MIACPCDTARDHHHVGIQDVDDVPHPGTKELRGFAHDFIRVRIAEHGRFPLGYLGPIPNEQYYGANVDRIQHVGVHVVVRAAGVVERLVGESARHGAIADHRHDLEVAARWAASLPVIVPLLALLLAILPESAGAQTSAEQEVRAVVDRLFDGMRAGDSASNAAVCVTFSPST